MSWTRYDLYGKKPLYIKQWYNAQAKSTGKLIQALTVFKACSIQPLVENADAILHASRR